MSNKRTYFEIYKKQFDSYFEFFEMGNVYSFPGLDGLHKKIALQAQIKSDLQDLRLDTTDFLTILISFKGVEKKYPPGSDDLVIPDFIENVLPDIKREFSISKSNFKPNIILIYGEPVNFNTYVLGALARYMAKKAHLYKIEKEIGLVNNSMEKLIDMLPEYVTDKGKEFIKNYNGKEAKEIAALIVACGLENYTPQHELIKLLNNSYELQHSRQNLYDFHVKEFKGADFIKKGKDARYQLILKIRKSLQE